MKKILITLISILAIGFLATQVLAWTHGYGHRGFMSNGRTTAGAVCPGWSAPQQHARLHDGYGRNGYGPAHRYNGTDKPYNRHNGPAHRHIWDGPFSQNR